MKKFKPIDEDCTLKDFDNEFCTECPFCVECYEKNSEKESDRE